MGKPIQSSSGIVKRQQTHSLTPSERLLEDYLHKFAMIASREMPQDGELHRIFAAALDDMDAKSLERGLKAYLREGTRFPWPAEIRELGEL